MWEKEMMLAVLRKHNTLFDGEDLQMGVILHSFNAGYAIKTVAHVSVETAVPAHFWCFSHRSPQAKRQYNVPVFHDIARPLVAPFKCNGWGCGFAVITYA